MSCSKKTRHSGLLELIAWGRAELSKAGIEEAQEECERALMNLLGCSRSEIYLEEHELEDSGVRGRFLAIIEKRLQRVPLAYLLKEADFWQETLYVDERCLIPRPETEILVEQVLNAFGGAAGKGFSFLDIGTGSGAIAIAILGAFKKAHGTLLDISGEALEVARRNIEKYGLQDRAMLVQGDIFNFAGARDLGLGTRNENSTREASPERHVPVFDLIVSNPPYLSAEDWTKVQEELKFEPKGALDGGKDGLDFYRKIIAGGKEHLSLGGLIAFEVGQGQAEQVSKWLQEAGYDNIQRFNDHLQVQRVVTAQRHS
jgi:release factor glutamine methyltransferase